MMPDKPFKICVFSQIYNEMASGNLKRWVNNVMQFCDAVGVYSDGSDDGSYDYLVPFCDVLIHKKTNDWRNELKHKQELAIEIQEKIKPDFIFWLDMDEVASKQIVENIQEICMWMRANKYDGMFFKEINLWKSEEYYRTDNQFFDGWFCRLWDCGASKKLKFNTATGLHQQQHPTNIYFTGMAQEVVLHYGFSSEKYVTDKWQKYKKLGQKGYPLDRISPQSEELFKDFKLEKVNKEWFPKEVESR